MSRHLELDAFEGQGCSNLLRRDAEVILNFRDLLTGFVSLADDPRGDACRLDDRGAERDARIHEDRVLAAARVPAHRELMLVVELVEALLDRLGPDRLPATLSRDQPTEC